MKELDCLRDCVATLRGQLTLLRMRAECGIPISVESLARAEGLAREIEAARVEEEK